MVAARKLYVLGFCLCAALMGMALYLELVKGLAPCPLCIMQRVMIIGMGLVFLIAALQRASRFVQIVYGVLLLMLASAGLFFAGRQIWLQHLPAGQVPACGPDLAFMLKHFPLSETVQVLFRGTGDCAKVVWTLWGMSIPEWSFVAFLGLGVLVLLSFKRNKLQ